MLPRDGPVQGTALRISHGRSGETLLKINFHVQDAFDVAQTHNSWYNYEYLNIQKLEAVS